MPSCAAFGCKNRPQNKIPGITFHRFPKNIALRNEWLLAVRRVNFRPTKTSILCSEHFSENQIDRTSLVCVRLKENAVPTLFTGYPKHLQKKLKSLSSTENKSTGKLKRKCIVKEEDSMSDEGLEKHEDAITHSEVAEGVNSSENFSTENTSTGKLKRKCIVKEEDSMSDEGLEKHEEAIIHSKVAEVNSSEIFWRDKNCSSESTNENGLSCHPNILKIIPKNKLKSLSSTENTSTGKLKRNCIVKEEDSMSDEGLEKHEEAIIHSEVAEEVNSSENFVRDKNSSSESTNEKGLSCHPNILKIIPENVSKDVPISMLYSNCNLNPDLIDHLTSSASPHSSDGIRSEVLTQSNLSNELMLQRKVQELEIKNLNYRKKIRMLQQKNRRQEAKINALKNQIRDLETNGIIDEDISEDCISENEIYEELLKHQMENNANGS